MVVLSPCFLFQGVLAFQLSGLNCSSFPRSSHLLAAGTGQLHGPPRAQYPLIRETYPRSLNMIEGMFQNPKPLIPGYWAF